MMITTNFQTLHPPPKGGHLHNRGLLGEGIHAAAAGGERDASVATEAATRVVGATSSVVADQVTEEATTATRIVGATSSVVANQVTEEESEKQETWTGD